MSGAGQTLYLKIEQNCIVYERLVRLRDIAKAECADPEICRQVKEIELYQFHGGQRKDFVQVFSVLWVIRRIHQQYPDLEISSVGVPDFVVRYEPDPEKKWLQYLKVAALCVILFFGAAFTIMTFIKDVSADEVFEQFYQRLTGTASTGITPPSPCTSSSITAHTSSVRAASIAAASFAGTKRKPSVKGMKY